MDMIYFIGGSDIKKILPLIIIILVISPIVDCSQININQHITRKSSKPEYNFYDINKRFNKTYGGKDEDIGYSVKQTIDGGYIICSITKSFDVIDWDVWLVKTDSNGIRLWDKTFGGNSVDQAYSVQQTKERGYIIAGYTRSYGKDRTNNAWLIKTDANGNEMWNKTYGKENDGVLYSIQQTSDGNYISCGSIYNDDGPNTWLIKTDANGNEMWNKTYGKSNTMNNGNSITLTNDGCYVICGLLISYESAGDVFLIKTDGDGDEIWNITYGGIKYDEGFSIKETYDNGYIICGQTSSYGAGFSDIWLIKTDENGEEIWNKTYGYTNMEIGYSVYQTNDRGFILTGSKKPYSPGGTDLWLIKTNNDGDITWEKTYGGDGFDEGRSVQQTSFGGYIVCGYTETYGFGLSDVWLIKTNRDGDALPCIIDISPNNPFRRFL